MFEMKIKKDPQSFSQSLHGDCFTGKGWHLLRSNGERQMRGQRAREHLPTAPTKDFLPSDHCHSDSLPLT